MPIINLTKDPNDQKRTATPLGLTAAQHPELAGTVVYDDVIHMAASTTEQDEVGWDYVGISPVTLNGLLQRRVVHSTITGLYSFYYRLAVDPTSVAHVYKLIVYPAMGSQIEADYRIDGLGEFAPASVNAGLPDPYGDFDGYPAEMVFEFDGPLMPGQSSKFLLITPSPKAHPDGSVDFAHSGALGFSPTGSTVALKINSSLLPIGFTFPAPAVAAPHPIHPPIHLPGVGSPTEQHLAGEPYRPTRR